MKEQIFKYVKVSLILCYLRNGWELAQTNLGFHRIEYNWLMKWTKESEPVYPNGDDMLNFDELRMKNLERCQTGFGHSLDSWNVAEWACATAGEVGEACNIAKKILRFRDNVKGNKKSKEEYIKDLATEIAGSLIYLDLWAASQGIDLGQAVKDEFNNKSKEIGSNVFI